MLKILFTTDFSVTANNAFLYALHMCENYKGELHVLHSYAPDVTKVKTNDLDSLTLNAFDEYQTEVQMMRKHIEALNLVHVEVKFILEEGELVQNVQELLTKERYDLMIMGTNGKSGFENRILGSKTMAVIKNVKIPVISVPHLSKFEGIDAVGFTTIYDELDLIALKSMAPYAKENNADIYCLHVNKTETEQENTVMADWKNLFSEEPVIFVERKGEDVVKTAFDFMEQQSLDIMSCVTRNKSLIEELFYSSVAKNLAYHKRIPLLTYHENFLNSIKEI